MRNDYSFNCKSSNIIVNHYYYFSLEYYAKTAGACRADDFRIDVALTLRSFSDTPNVLHLCVALRKFRCGAKEIYVEGVITYQVHISLKM